jgi:hypothetical protein
MERKLPPISPILLEFPVYFRGRLEFFYIDQTSAKLSSNGCSDPHPTPLQNVGDPVEYGVPVGHMLFHSYTGKSTRWRTGLKRSLNSDIPWRRVYRLVRAAAALRTSPRRIQLAKMMNLPQIN